MALVITDCILENISVTVPPPVELQYLVVAGIGYTYDQSKDAFIPPKPYNSWLLDEATCRWNAPVAYPNDGKLYVCDETVVNWVEPS